MGIGRSTQRFGGDPNGAADAYMKRIVMLFDTVPLAGAAVMETAPWPSPDEVKKLADIYILGAANIPPKLYDQLYARLLENGATNANQTAALMHSMEWDKMISTRIESAKSERGSHRFQTWIGLLHAAYEVMRNKGRPDDFGLIARLDRLDFLMRCAMSVTCYLSYAAIKDESLHIIGDIKRTQTANDVVLEAANTFEKYLNLCIPKNP